MDLRHLRFCEALAELSDGGGPRYVAITAVALRMGIAWEEATVLADECAQGGLVKHDLSSSSTAHGLLTDLPHSVSLDRKGWELLWSSVERRPLAKDSSKGERVSRRRPSGG